MQRRQLGQSGLAIAPLMLGGNVFGWNVDRPSAFALLDRFVDAGFNAIDTADVYSAWSAEGVGISETIIGEWLAKSGKRDQVVIATKVGLAMGEGKSGLSAAYIEAAVEDSLRRLGSDYIDIYFAHCDDPDTPQDETQEAFDRLVKAGKVRCLGASNFAAGRLQSALNIAGAGGMARYEVLQPLYNLIDRSVFEDSLLPLCQQANIGVTPYFGLASGFLTGKYRSRDDLVGAARGRMVTKYLNPRGMRILDALDSVAKRHELVPAQIAIAWLIARPTITAAIVSATSLPQLDQIMKAADIVLTPHDVAELDAASRPDEGAEATIA